MAYFPLIVIFAQRYQKDAGIGTVVSMMLPYVLVLSVVVDALLRRLVPARHPARPGLPVHLDVTAVRPGDRGGRA